MAVSTTSPALCKVVVSQLFMKDSVMKLAKPTTQTRRVNFARPSVNRRWTGKPLRFCSVVMNVAFSGIASRGKSSLNALAMRAFMSLAFQRNSWFNDSCMNRITINASAKGMTALATKTERQPYSSTKKAANGLPAIVPSENPVHTSTVKVTFRCLGMNSPASDMALGTTP